MPAPVSLPPFFGNYRQDGKPAMPNIKGRTSDPDAYGMPSFPDLQDVRNPSRDRAAPGMG